MWLLMELIIVLGLVAMISVELFDGTHREAIEREGRQIAAVVEELQEGVDAYVAQTGEIATCLDLRGVVADWIDGRDSRTKLPATPMRGIWKGSTPGREASMWHPVALFPASTTSPPTPSTSNYDGARKVCEKATYLLAGDWYLPSLAEAGLLPPALDGLEYSSTASDEYWGRYNLRFRLWARYANATSATPAGTIPTAGHQAVIETLLVVAGDPLPEAIAQAARRAIDSGAVGIISSRDFSDPPVTGLRANLDVMGAQGGWSREICADTTATPSSGYLSKGNVPLCTAATFGHTTTVSGVDVLHRADILPLSAESDFGFRRASVAADGYISGAAPDETPQAVITLVSRGAATDALARALHRSPTGDPALHRMHTELNMGGFGVLNAPFISGIDDDGDGYPNYGVHTVGPNPSDKAVTSPNVVHGDLVVTGNLQIGCDELSFAEDTSLTTKAAGGTIRTTGNVHACGSMLLGEEGTFYGDELRPERSGSTDIASGNLLVAGNTQHGLTTAARGTRTKSGFDDHLRGQTADGYYGTVYARRSLYVQDEMSQLTGRPTGAGADAWDRALLVVGNTKGATDNQVLGQMHIGAPESFNPRITLTDRGLFAATATGGQTLLVPGDAQSAMRMLAIAGDSSATDGDRATRVHIEAGTTTPDDGAWLRIAAPDEPTATGADYPLGVKIEHLDADATLLQADSQPSGHEQLDHSLPALVPRAYEEVDTTYPTTGTGLAADLPQVTRSTVYTAEARDTAPTLTLGPAAPLEGSSTAVAPGSPSAQDLCSEGSVPLFFTSPMRHMRAYSSEYIDDYTFRDGREFVTADHLPDALSEVGQPGAILTDPDPHTHATVCTSSGSPPAMRLSCKVSDTSVKLDSYAVDATYETSFDTRAYQNPWTGWSLQRGSDGYVHDAGSVSQTKYRYYDPTSKSEKLAVGEARGDLSTVTVVYCTRLPSGSYKTAGP